MRNSVIAAASGTVAAATSLGMIAEQAQQWQAFWGIMVGVVSVCILGWATYRNQKRQDEKLSELKRHNAATERRYPRGGKKS